jgi:hypothetical protein
LTTFRKISKKILAIFLGILSIFLILDILHHYMILRFTENWLRSSRQNSFEIRLNLLPLGEASVDVLNFVSKEQEEKLTIQKIHLHGNLFQFSKIHLTADIITHEPFKAEKVTAEIEHTSDTLIFNPLVIHAFQVKGPLMTLTSQKILGTSLYQKSNATLNLDIMIPQIAVNHIEALGVQLSGDLILRQPYAGQLTLKTKGIEAFSQVLRHAGYLDPLKVQILGLGVMFLRDHEGDIRLKFHFKNNEIFLGPIKIR